MDSCVFCDIVNGTAPADVIRETVNSLIIVPLNPVVAGHVIALPKVHATDAGEKPLVTGDVMADISRWAKSMPEPYNLITSSGAEATQSVRHLHIHYVPRHEGDGLALPWTGQVTT